MEKITRAVYLLELLLYLLEISSKNYGFFLPIFKRKYCSNEYKCVHSVKLTTRCTRTSPVHFQSVCDIEPKGFREDIALMAS